MIIKVFDFLTHGRKPIQALVIRRTHPKTLMCEVERQYYQTTKYGGVFRRRKNFQVHDEYEMARIGDIVRIKHSKKYSKMKSHSVYDILKPNEGQAYMEQHPEYSAAATVRKDRKRRQKEFEMSLQDPITQMKFMREHEAEEKKHIADRLERLKKRDEAKEAVKLKKQLSAQKQAEKQAATREKNKEAKKKKKKGETSEESEE